MARVHKLMQIFRAGTQRDMSGREMTFSQADIQGIARSYSTRTRPAPLTIGHPENDRPVYGEVTGLFVKGEKLYAQANVDTDMVALVRKRAYTGVSASFFMPGSSGNPNPDGGYYLKHVSFLGAVPPAVRGMDPLNFGEAENLLDFAEALAVPALSANATTWRNWVVTTARHYQTACPGLSYDEAERRVIQCIPYD